MSQDAYAHVIDAKAQASPLLMVNTVGRCLQDRWIWQDICFEVDPGDRLAIVGPSGTGKSLLLRALAGLDPIQAGQICFRGQPLSDWAMPQLRSQVIYLHQQPALLEGTVESNLQQIYTLAIHRRKAYDRDRVLSYLSLLGRDADFLNRTTEQLSGGERQIVACLWALQLAPQILLLDEPTASLDRIATQQLETLVDQWQQQAPDRVCLWTSHDDSQLERVATRQLALVDQGQIFGETSK